MGGTREVASDAFASPGWFFFPPFFFTFHCLFLNPQVFYSFLLFQYFPLSCWGGGEVSEGLVGA